MVKTKICSFFTENLKMKRKKGKKKIVMPQPRQVHDHVY